MNYSKLGNEQISELIEKRLKVDPWINTENRYHNYCGNPSDAWPIIASRKISLVYDPDIKKWEASVIVGKYPDAKETLEAYALKTINHYDYNPLRAAMIVYLMMEQSE